LQQGVIIGVGVGHLFFDGGHEFVHLAVHVLLAVFGPQVLIDLLPLALKQHHRLLVT
jgi:hypothetical protein